MSTERVKLGLTQTELAQRAGIGQPQVSAIEAGRTKNTKDETLISVANALGLDPTEMRKGNAVPARDPLLSDRLHQLGRKLNRSNVEKLISYGEGLLTNQVVTPFRSPPAKPDDASKKKRR